MQEWTPSHLELQRWYFKGWLIYNNTGIIAFQPGGPSGQGDNQVISLGECHRSLIVSGKHSDPAFLTQFSQRGIDPAKSLDVSGIDADPDPHAGFAHPNVVGVLNSSPEKSH